MPSLLLHWFRCKKPIFTASQLEQIAEILVWLLLDRGLQGLSLLLQESLISVTESFKEEEWVSSCKNIANSLASRFEPPFLLVAIMLVVLLEHKVSYLPIQSKLRLWVNAFIHSTLVFDSQESDENLMSSLWCLSIWRRRVATSSERTWCWFCQRTGYCQVSWLRRRQYWETCGLCFSETVFVISIAPIFGLLHQKWVEK